MEDATQLSKMKVADLKKELKSRGLSVAGNKTELIERLQEAIGSGNVELGQVEGDDEDFDEEEILGGEDMDAAELGKLTPQEEEAALGGNIRVRDEAALLEQPEKKKISLKRSAPPLEPPPTTVVEAAETENEPPASQEEEKGPDESASAKKIIKLDSGSEKNAIETRAERFGIPMTEEARRLARAARFGTATNGATVNKKPAKLSMETGGTDVEKLKARAERFGEVTSKSLAKRVKAWWMVVVWVCGCWGQESFTPYERGPYSTTRVEVGSLLTVGLDENLDVWVPTDAGTYSVFYFLDGFGGAIPGIAYDQTMAHMASHGMAVVVLWKIAAPINPEDRLPLFTSVMLWAEDHLEKKLHNKGLNDTVHLDFDNLVVGGHSAGAHVQVEYLKTTCGKFKGQVFMSPVDGLLEFCITPGVALNYVIPTLHLAAGLDNVPGVSGYPCAPDEISNDRFYEAMDSSSQRWSINATKFGHGDFLDPLYQEALEVLEFCGYNQDATPEEFEAYRRYVAGQTVTFVKALFSEGDCAQYLPYLEDTTRMIVDAVEQHQNPVGGCPVAGCSWTPPPSPPTTTHPSVTTSTFQ
ncbi:uncharacterized protein [Procambarus clarkii]|uniref:uncharacterized protein isoform X2 n=1 Tax=Procambarus clarkii TaxID=6728 RepID=UPI00374360B1